MPGPVSDSYDSEFGTAAHAELVMDAIRGAVRILDDTLGPGDGKTIVQVVSDPPRAIQTVRLQLALRDVKLMRWALMRALEGV